jgi:hypothetical protein
MTHTIRGKGQHDRRPVYRAAGWQPIWKVYVGYYNEPSFDSLESAITFADSLGRSCEIYAAWRVG